ncbi:uncharacterized protein LOC123713408 [Pieris brassicae]|uniref:uncharacterized protein LOC123713408 n=1 Tax=Pieris brassicae TaxID=7116 RepID=UPI001E661CF5|nr:uncharacterized protein LOC123713408 [Pieris brassicae]
MADAALARREARRRKILENSHNRLQRISGKSGDESCKDSLVHSPIPDYQDVVSSEFSCSKTLLSNGVSSSSISPTLSLGLASDEIVNQNEVINDLASLLPQNVSNDSNTETPQVSSLLDNIVCYKYDIVILSLIIQILYSLSIISIEGTYYFLPLFIYAGTKMYWFTQQMNGTSSFANVLMLLKGISTYRVQKFLNAIQIVSAIGLDSCIFLFTTICVQVVYIFISEIFII